VPKLDADVASSGGAGPQPRRNWIADGGWALIIGGVILTFGMFFRIWQDLGPARQHHIGNGTDVQSYQFDLSNFSLDLQYLAARGAPKDLLPAMVDPGHISPDALGTGDMKGRGKYVVTNDRVIGVTIGGESRAYPVLVMNWHEVVNDTLGGVPIAVTYSPLTDSVVVFDRRAGDEVLEFGISGLLYNGNLVFHDRRGETAAESLWLQLACRAVSGPAEGTPLKVLPSVAVEWQDWLREHPETTIVNRDPDLVESYKKDPYGPYYQTEHLRFEVSPIPPGDVLQRLDVELKDRVLVLGSPEQPQLVTYDSVLAAAQFDATGLGTAVVTVSGRPLQFHCRQATAGFAPATIGLPAGTAEGAWLSSSLFYGWYAIHYAARPAAAVACAATP
jgi:hypothetical protein